MCPAGLVQAEPDSNGRGEEGRGVDDAPEPGSVPPVPVDVCVRPETRCVIITGPNTGGKTATLKARPSWPGPAGAARVASHIHTGLERAKRWHPGQAQLGGRQRPGSQACDVAMVRQGCFRNPHGPHVGVPHGSVSLMAVGSASTGIPHLRVSRMHPPPSALMQGVWVGGADGQGKLCGAPEPQTLNPAQAFGLAVLMAKAGCAVPAAAPAHLPPFSMVLADIGDEQSLAANLSTFSGHLRRIQVLIGFTPGFSQILRGFRVLMAGCTAAARAPAALLDGAGGHRRRAEPGRHPAHFQRPPAPHPGPGSHRLHESAHDKHTCSFDTVPHPGPAVHCAPLFWLHAPNTQTLPCCRCCTETWHSQVKAAWSAAAHSPACALWCRFKGCSVQQYLLLEGQLPPLMAP